jgi:hypothetical protein
MLSSAANAMAGMKKVSASAPTERVQILEDDMATFLSTPPFSEHTARPDTRLRISATLISAFVHAKKLTDPVTEDIH